MDLASGRIIPVEGEASGVPGPTPMVWSRRGGAMNARNLRDCRRFLGHCNLKSASSHSDWVSGTRHLRDCRHFWSLTLCTRFKTCPRLQGWANSRHDRSGCGRCWSSNISNIPPRSLCVLLTPSENLKNPAQAA